MTICLKLIFLCQGVLFVCINNRNYIKTLYLKTDYLG